MVRQLSLAPDCREANRLLGHIWLDEKTEEKATKRLDDHARECGRCKEYNFQLELKEAAKVRA
jgi:hypothetical protein